MHVLRYNCAYRPAAMYILTILTTAFTLQAADLVTGIASVT